MLDKMWLVGNGGLIRAWMSGRLSVHRLTPKVIANGAGTSLAPSEALQSG